MKLKSPRTRFSTTHLMRWPWPQKCWKSSKPKRWTCCTSTTLSRTLSALYSLAPSPPRLPFIPTLHGTDITLVGSNRSYLPITKFSIEQSDGVTAISQYLLKQTLKEFDIRRPIEVIPNFVNCDLYTRQPHPAQRAKWAPAGEPILMHLSNFRPVKRITDAAQ